MANLFGVDDSGDDAPAGRSVDESVWQLEDGFSYLDLGDGRTLFQIYRSCYEAFC